jgi:hypothetical protein
MSSGVVARLNAELTCSKPRRRNGRTNQTFVPESGVSDDTSCWRVTMAKTTAAWPAGSTGNEYSSIESTTRVVPTCKVPASAGCFHCVFNAPDNLRDLAIAAVACAPVSWCCVSASMREWNDCPIGCGMEDRLYRVVMNSVLDGRATVACAGIGEHSEFLTSVTAIGAPTRKSSVSIQKGVSRKLVRIRRRKPGREPTHNISALGTGDVAGRTLPCLDDLCV